MNATIETTFELFFDQLRDLHSMEIQLCESMPHLVSLCTNEHLRDLIAEHSLQNSSQIRQIQWIFDRYGESPEYGMCKAMEGLIKGGTFHLEGVRCPHTRDQMMIGLCLRIEFYEMEAYEFTGLLSERLGMMREPEILRELLAEEKEMAAALIQLEPNLYETAGFRTGGKEVSRGEAPSFVAFA